MKMSYGWSIGSGLILVLTINNHCMGSMANNWASPRNNCRIELTEKTSEDGVFPVLNKTHAAFLLILGFGGFSLFLAVLYKTIRKRVFHDVNKLDSAFDAGGNITWSLTAVTVASQFFWPGDILHSATLTAKIGVAGAFWYSVGVLANILLFPVFSVSLKTHAPGAKTYLQIFRARFGRTAHIVFSGFALATTTMIMTSTLLAGKAMIQSLVEDVSDEFVLMTMAFLFGSYSLVGGLGTTFYVSYFNACLVFVILIAFAAKVVYFPPQLEDISTSPLGNISAIYETLVCLVGPEGNTERSYLTFQSSLGFLYGTLSILLGTATTFCDQALWQSRIAAKPLPGVWGFLVGGLIWFTVPMTMASATGLSYLVLSHENGSHLLTPGEINEGLATPFVAEKILGKAGGIMILTMGTMALMSTGSGEVMGLSSIIIYDIYQVYIQPFRKYFYHTQCILCGMDLPNVSTAEQNGTDDHNLPKEDTCSCISIETCLDCVEDVKLLQTGQRLAYNHTYKCLTHGPYRAYQDELVQTKNWCILFLTICLVPFGLIIFGTGIDLNWMFYCGSIFTIPCFIPVILSIVWAKATATGLISGALTGLISGVASALIAASTLDGGLGHFLLNTAHEFTITIGCYTAFLSSFFVCIAVSVLTHKIKNGAHVAKEWEKTQHIDNPLNPWHLCYKQELVGMEYSGRPSLEQLARAFKPARYSALIGGLVLVIFGLGVMPGVMSIFPVLTSSEFTGWITFCHVWAVVMGLVVVFVAPIEEVVKVLKQKQVNIYKTHSASSERNSYLYSSDTTAESCVTSKTL